MRPQHLALGCVLGAVATAAAAQGEQVLRWREASTPALGLRPAHLQLRVSEVQPNPLDRILGRRQSPGLDLRWTARPGGDADLGIYGRVASIEVPHLPAFGPAGGGLAYGVGLRWDFSARASAVLGWDSYDLRTAAGERDLWATSLGLQIRY